MRLPRGGLDQYGRTGSDHTRLEGFIVPIRDADALLECMRRVPDDPAMWLRMRAAGLERVRRVGGWAEYGDQWQGMLQQLTGKT